MEENKSVSNIPKPIKMPFTINMLDTPYFSEILSPTKRPNTIAAAKKEKPIVIGKGESGLYSLKYKEIQSAIAPSHNMPQKAIKERIIRYGPKFKIEDFGLDSSCTGLFVNRFGKLNGINKILDKATKLKCSVVVKCSFSNIPPKKAPAIKPMENTA